MRRIATKWGPRHPQVLSRTSASGDGFELFIQGLGDGSSTEQVAWQPGMPALYCNTKQHIKRQHRRIRRTSASHVQDIGHRIASLKEGFAACTDKDRQELKTDFIQFFRLSTPKSSNDGWRTQAQQGRAPSASAYTPWIRELS
jgi:hypothetical protein